MARFTYPTRRAIEKLCQELDLQRPDAYSQEWEYETAYETRIEEFIDYYLNNDLDDETKFTLMLVIVNSANEAGESEKLDAILLNRIISVLTNDKEIHENTIRYWSMGTEDLEDCFYITPYVREVEKLIDKHET